MNLATTTYLGDAGDFKLVNDFARHTPWLHGIMTAYAKDGIVLFVLMIAVGYWLGWRRNDVRMVAASVWAAIGTLTAVGINQPIVNAVAERRPYQSMQNVLLLVSRSNDYGFPSDHATMAGAVATALLYVNRKLGVVAWALAIILAFSRVYVGAHYPHDVVAGLILGAAVIVIGRLVAQPLLVRLLEVLALTSLGRLVGQKKREAVAVP